MSYIKISYIKINNNIIIIIIKLKSKYLLIIIIDSITIINK